MSSLDVLIVGGGPTGLILALELAVQNVSFRIVDAAQGRCDKSRAMVMHPRSLELLNRHGLTGRILEKGKLNFGNRVYVQKKFVFALDMKDTPFQDTSYPFPTMISQVETERILDDVLLTDFGAKVEMGVRAETITQDEKGVTTVLRRADGTQEEVRSKYIVGCDGAHSIVRKAADLAFDGSICPQDFILADVHLKWDQPDNLYLCMGYGFCGLFPMKDGLYRLVCSRPDYLHSDREPTLDDFKEVTSRLLPGNVEIWDPVWITRFHIHTRIASNYRQGRMFVAGDAAHIHSPAGGQGMNTGIQDAVNLAWKLAAVLRGEHGDALLDTYNVERRKIGLSLLAGTDKLFEFLATSSTLFLWLRNALVPWILPVALRSPETRAHRFRFISQLNIRYRNSPLVGQASTWLGKIRGGDRAPNGKLDGDSTTLLDLCRRPIHHLVLFSGVDEQAIDEQVMDELTESFLEDAGEGMNVVKIITKTENTDGKGEAHLDEQGRLHETYGFREAGMVLVRPDGYIAYLGPLSAVAELDTFWRRQKEL